MRLAIMQPYLFPYIGYFQLVNAVDKFIFYDDVNFIKGGWINRNRLLFDGVPRYFTAPLLNASSFAKINALDIDHRRDWIRSTIESIRHNYSKAPFYHEIFPMLSLVFDKNTKSIAELARASVISVSDYLQLNTEFVTTSSIYRNASLTGVRRVVDICRQENANIYVNLPGGRALYEPTAFQGVELCFIETRLPPYPQQTTPFVSGLSILDALMQLGPETAKLLKADISK